jgi:hypothetical protein
MERNDNGATRWIEKRGSDRMNASLDIDGLVSIGWVQGGA